MKKLISVTIALFICLSTVFSQGLKSPKEFLRTEYGSHFTPHYLVADYVRHVAENSDRVTLIEYGETNEDRPLLLATITTPSNHSNLENIQKSHLSKIGMQDGEPAILEDNFAIVWLSFGVHGNEAGGSESSMNVLYELANPANSQTAVWLERTVVLFDPSLNPDGYNRYTQWARSIGGKTPHPGLTDREHMEPWPGGRVNHYLFDLNRDWAWQTQVESQQRIVQYHKWMPHVHVDFHEMGYDQGYYFAPAAEPYHKHITDFQREMQVDIGKNNAKYFDKEGWLYFTREVFDLLYPSYGDTYPTFNGAVGMTYEQAGHGMAGREISLSNGDTLKIQDRIDHHTKTALSTVEEASNQVTRLSKNFEMYFSKAVSEPQGKYKSYVIKSSEKADRLVELLTKNKIQYYRAEDSNDTLSGYDYMTNALSQFIIREDDIIINANQPNGNLLQVLMEPEPVLSDSVTYDITAWALPHAYGVQAYAMETYVLATAKLSGRAKPINCFSFLSDDYPPYAYVIPWNSTTSAQMLSKLYKKGIKVRMANKDVKFDEGVVKKGSIVIVRGDNFNVKDLPRTVASIARNCMDCFCLFSGFSKEGGDVGGSSFSRLSHPKALLISGRGTSPYNVGQVWHYFDEVIGYPLSIVDKQDMGRVNLDDFNTLILPDGWYRLSKNELENVSDFVNGGGKVIAISSALGNFVDKDDFALSKYASDDEKKAAKKELEKKEMASRKDSYHDQERRGISNTTAGAVIRNTLDTSHPLAFGLGESYHSLKTSSQHYSLLKDAWNVVTVPKDYTSFGFIGQNLASKIEESVTFAVEEKGGGQVIYMVDNPLYRGFWENGVLLFSNALFLVD